jgi:hypothetical protein
MDIKNSASRTKLDGDENHPMIPTARQPSFEGQRVNKKHCKNDASGGR